MQINTYEGISKISYLEPNTSKSQVVHPNLALEARFHDINARPKSGSHFYSRKYPEPPRTSVIF
jgi:hypothetical protein